MIWNITNIIIGMWSLVCLCAVILVELSDAQSIGAVQCHNRREISPCTCYYNDATARRDAMKINCEGVEGFGTIVSALTAQFDPTMEIFLTISKSNLEDLGNSSFGHLNLNIYRLHLNLNNLRHLPEEVFIGLPRVEYLNLADNHLSTIPKHILPLMPRIKVLDLQGGNITSVLSHDLKNLPLLHTLTLVENGISVLEEDSMPVTVTRLNLSRNNLTTLNNTLRGMSDLQWLFLNGNRLVSLENQLPNEEELKLMHISAEFNLLRYPPSDLRRCSFITSLRLDNNRIEALNGHLSLMRNMDHLNLTHNNLTYLRSDDFATLDKLNYLQLNYNHLNTLNGSLLPLKRLREVHLDHNNLTVFDFQDLKGLEYLEIVFLSYNHINHLVSRAENMVGSDVKMDELYLDHNQLETLGGALMNLATLKILNLSHNSIKTISPEDFIGLDALQILDVSFNRLTTLEETSKTLLPMLDKLDASNNEITRLDNDFHGLPRLCWAELNNNKIENISIRLVEHTSCQLYNVPSTLRIYLHGNPAICRSSELDKLVQMTAKNGTEFNINPQDCLNTLEPEIMQHPFFKKP